MHGRIFHLRELRYGFEDDRFSVRVDLFPEALAELEDPEFRVTIGAAEETNSDGQARPRPLARIRRRKGPSLACSIPKSSRKLPSSASSKSPSIAAKST